MAHSNEGKFSNIYKLLSEHNFQLNVTDKFKCIKCKRILINACQSPCGCRFCRKCVDELLVGGCAKCPGNTGDCKSENLSNISQDHIMNMKISKLLVKCPEQLCGFECQLIEMEGHMRLCSKKSVVCPCHDLGCNDDNLMSDKINEHLQTESYNHWTMLMGIIGDLRNEVTQLRNAEIEKDKSIEQLSEDVKLLKVKKEMSREPIDVRKDNSDSEIETMVREINVKIESIKMERVELSIELGDLNDKLKGIRAEMDVRLDETRRSYMGHVDNELTLINGVMRKYQEMSTIIEEMKPCDEGKVLGTRFLWAVDKISGISGFSWLRISSRESEYFFSKINQYKMQLRMCNHKSQLLIHLLIHSGTNDTNLKWPFKANVTVKVTNKTNVGSFKDVTKHCKIERPLNNSYSNNYKDPFKFPIEDLISSGLLLGDCCIVECLVDLQ